MKSNDNKNPISCHYKLLPFWHPLLASCTMLKFLPNANTFFTSSALLHSDKCDWYACLMSSPGLWSESSLGWWTSADGHKFICCFDCLGMDFSQVYQCSFLLSFFFSLVLTSRALYLVDGTCVLSLIGRLFKDIYLALRSN